LQARQRADGLSWLLAAVGLAALAAAVAFRPADAAAAAAQDWPPFVLVAGLLLIGLVADGDGLFEAAGARLARLAPTGALLFVGAVVLVSGVTATLNLDTSVAFLTPVLVHTARTRRAGEPALLYGCLLLSNAGSLLLPGSNLTNLIVLGHLRLTGGQFASRMWLPWLAAVAVTALVVAIGERRSLATVAAEVDQGPRPVLGVGLIAVIAATVLVIAVRSSALPVFAVGVVAAGARLTLRRRPAQTAVGEARVPAGVQDARWMSRSYRCSSSNEASMAEAAAAEASTAEATEAAAAAEEVTLRPVQVWQVLGVPVLTGLFGAAVALGTLGRAWSGPAHFLAQLSGWSTAGFAAAATVVVNNLPAASLLAARTPTSPFPLLIGLNLGPNLCVTGSLAWLLWLRAARAAGSRPSLRRASLLGLAAVPLSVAVALAALTVTR
jgi:arsenical pump membrane protein